MLVPKLIAIGAFALALAPRDTQANSGASGALAPAALTIHIKNFTFAPTPAVVRPGDRVTFVNDDDEAHTVTSVDKTFDSAGLDTNGTWQHVFGKPGTYAYFCELHPYMKATIVVRASAS